MLASSWNEATQDYTNRVMGMSDFAESCGQQIVYGVIILFVFLVVTSNLQSNSSSNSQDKQPTRVRVSRSVNSYSDISDDYLGMNNDYEDRSDVERDPKADIAMQEFFERKSSADATNSVQIATAEAKWMLGIEAATDEAMLARDAQQSSSNSSGASYTTTNLNVRTGPSVNCPVLSSLNQNSTIIPIYCNADCSWLLLSGSGWVSAGYVANPPAGLSVYSNIPACAYGGSSLVVQPAPTIARPSCGGGCTQPPSGCNIKGNVGYNSGERIYHVPGQAYYNDTVINSRYGERWFCTESEAQAAGWRRAYQ